MTKDMPAFGIWHDDIYKPTSNQKKNVFTHDLNIAMNNINVNIVFIRVKTYGNPSIKLTTDQTEIIHINHRQIYRSQHLNKSMKCLTNCH